MAGQELMLQQAATALGFDITRLPPIQRTYAGASQHRFTAPIEQVHKSCACACAICGNTNACPAASTDVIWCIHESQERNSNAHVLLAWHGAL